MHNKVPIITLDGPSGSGKGVISIKLAKKLKWGLLDSGAIYRVIGLLAYKSNINMSHELAIEQLALNTKINMYFDAGLDKIRIFANQEELTDVIRSENAGALASQIGVFPKVRAALLAVQRAFAVFPGLVADGRDMGTVVFPLADLKIFLDATALARARRRFLQLQELGISANLENLAFEIDERDKRDRDRVVAPLKPADDAIVIDTTELSVDGVLAAIMLEVRKRKLDTLVGKSI